MAKTFFIIDGSSYIYRAFYAIRELSNAAGLPTNAVYGFTKMLLKIIKEKSPDYLAIAFDAKGDTFRNEMYAEYKANRPPMPDPLAQQIPYIHQMVSAFRIPLVQEQGLEADDLIGTLAEKGADAGLDVVVVTGDKDMYQLISPQVTLYDSMKDVSTTEDTIQEKFGIAPNQIIDMMGLMGDAVDNIPGVAGIGKKTAMQLIQTFGNIDTLLTRLDEVKQPKLRQKLENDAEIARLSRDLATIKMDCPMDFDLKQFKVQPPDETQLTPLCQELEFLNLLKELVPTPDAPELHYEMISEKTLSACLSKVQKDGALVFRLFSSETNPMNAIPYGLAFSTLAGQHYYLPLKEKPDFPKGLKQLFSLKDLVFYGHDIKPVITILNRHGIPFCGKLFDTKIAAYLINPMRRDYSLEGLALEYLKEQVESEQKGLFEQTDTSPETAAPIICREADLIRRLIETLKPRLETQSLTKLFNEMEMPLVFVLSGIEQNGVKIDTGLLKKMSIELEKKLAEITEKIYTLAGGEFNINSPKQLSEILFDRLGLTPIKKTKTGYSTNEDVLTQLSLKHPLPAEILNSRQIVKLKSTYIDALPRLVHPETGRIHTQLNQTVAATGRLSSTDPNLQNIPIRGEMGQRIREAFIAAPGNVLLSADYNQIELRLLAHLSNDPELLDAFKNRDDVHTRTAMELFDLPKDAVTQEMRRAAKSVNFGIIYGISPFGLSNNIGVPLQEAKRYIDRYFELYRGVQDFIESTLKTATEKGYVTTLFDRRRDIPELASKNSFTRGVGERLAINTPLQGSAADIIKLAMIHIWRWMADEGLKSKMTLQVHDELLFDAPEEEVPAIKDKVVSLMEGVVQLKVPMTVDIGVGKNWAEAH